MSHRTGGPPRNFEDRKRRNSPADRDDGQGYMRRESNKRQFGSESTFDRERRPPHQREYDPSRRPNWRGQSNNRRGNYGGNNGPPAPVPNASSSSAYGRTAHYSPERDDRSPSRREQDYYMDSHVMAPPTNDRYQHYGNVADNHSSAEQNTTSPYRDSNEQSQYDYDERDDFVTPEAFYAAVGGHPSPAPTSSSNGYTIPSDAQANDAPSVVDQTDVAPTKSPSTVIVTKDGPLSLPTDTVVIPLVQCEPVVASLEPALNDRQSDFESGFTMFSKIIGGISLSKAVRDDHVQKLCSSLSNWCATKRAMLENLLKTSFLEFVDAVKNDISEDASDVIRSIFSIVAVESILSIINYCRLPDQTMLRHLWSRWSTWQTCWSNFALGSQMTDVLGSHYSKMTIIILRCLPAFALWICDEYAAEVIDIAFEACPPSKAANENLKRLIHLNPIPVDVPKEHGDTGGEKDDSVGSNLPACIWTLNVTICVPCPTTMSLPSALNDFMSLEYASSKSSKLSKLLEGAMQRDCRYDLSSIALLASIETLLEPGNILSPSRLLEMQERKTTSTTSPVEGDEEDANEEDDEEEDDENVFLKSLPGNPCLCVASADPKTAASLLCEITREAFEGTITDHHWQSLKRDVEVISDGLFAVDDVDMCIL